MFKEFMCNTPETDEILEKYPFRATGVACAQMCPNNEWVCTRNPHDDNYHVAHMGTQRNHRVIAVWSDVIQ